MSLSISLNARDACQIARDIDRVGRLFLEPYGVHFNTTSDGGIDELYSTRHARGARKRTVTRQQHGVEHFGQCDVDGVIGAEVVAKRPHPLEQRLVGVALQIQRAKVIERSRCFRRPELAILRISPEGLYDLDVRQVRHVHRQGVVGVAL